MKKTPKSKRKQYRRLGRYTDIMEWNKATTSVYSVLLTDNSLFDAALKASDEVEDKRKGGMMKRPGIFRRVTKVKHLVSHNLRPEQGDNPLVDSMIEGFFDQVDWVKLTRRLIHQGKFDRAVYGTLWNKK